MKIEAVERRGAAALAAGILLVYAPALTAPVIYDDAAHVRDNVVLRLPFAEFWSGLVSRDYFSFNDERTYQPLVTLFHYAFHSVPMVYRSAGLGLHFVNAVLLYLVARRLHAGRRPAIFAACLFAAFPAHTELLNFSAFKGHLFAASFTLAVVLGVMELCADRSRKEKALPLAICCLFIFGLLSKETGLVAVALSLVYVALFARSEICRLRGLLLGFSVISVVYLWYRFSCLTPPPAFPKRFDYSTLASFSFYVRTLVAPYPLCLERTLPAGSLWPVWLAVFASAVWLLRKSKEGLFSLSWIAVSLLPFLHLISFSNVSPVADRYLYLPAAGLCLLLAQLIGRPLPNGVRKRHFLALWLGRAPRGEFSLAVLLAIWTSITASRNLVYRSTRALFEQTASCAPQNARAQFLLGMICFQEKDYGASRAAYGRVLALTDSPGARAALADIDREEKALRLSAP